VEQRGVHARSRDQAQLEQEDGVFRKSDARITPPLRPGRAQAFRVH
jgi:hypothetical protein